MNISEYLFTINKTDAFQPCVKKRFTAQGTIPRKGKHIFYFGTFAKLHTNIGSSTIGKAKCELQNYLYFAP